MEFTRRRFIATAGLAALAGCTSGVYGGTERSSTTAAGSNPDRSTSNSERAVPTVEELLTLSTDPGEFELLAVSGGPFKNGIPSIDNPSFIDPDDASFLNPGDPVFGVTKAYPQKILVQHEIVNDRLGDFPVAVTYCPLTGTVQGFERGETTFGVSGRLINNLVMYDRATEAWWPQILATSILEPWDSSPGTRSLREFKLVWTTWEQWRDLHPDTQILSTEIGSARNYGRDPYGSYNPPQGY